jgi:2-amino-4-hydroxy-6-hydroxymethyldihydropteridine diphosphokinase
MIPVFIALGSNIEPEKNLPAAVRLLSQQQGVEVAAVSRVYRSPAVGPDGQPTPDQPDFLNAAVLVHSDLPILRLKQDILRRIEAELGRVRTSDKFAPRPIDLDIVLYGEDVLGLVIEQLDGSGETIFPDPAIMRHAFLALPLADLDPDFIHPVSGERLSAIAARFRDDPGIALDPLRLYFS